MPVEQTTRRAELQHAIDVRLDDLITATHRSRDLRDTASRYTGNWRDVLFLCVGLFAVIWWNVPDSRTNWLPTFIVLILLTMVTAAYAARGLIRSLGNAITATTGTHPHRDSAGQRGQSASTAADRYLLDCELAASS
jgi:hypothetical protein